MPLHDPLIAELKKGRKIRCKVSSSSSSSSGSGSGSGSRSTSTSTSSRGGCSGCGGGLRRRCRRHSRRS